MFGFLKFFKGINIVPKTTSTASEAGDIDFAMDTNKLAIHNGSSASPAVTESHSATLTNKVLSGNTASNLVNGAGTININSSGTVTVPNATDTLVGKATTDTLTNKVLTGNTAANLVSGAGTLTLNTTGTVTVPNTTDTLVGKDTTDTLTNKTLSGNTATNLVNGSGTININSTGTITVPNATDTLVGKATTDTLTNKTLTAPVISTISNTGTLTLPTSTDTLVGRATTDTLTNKTLTSPVVTGLQISDFEEFTQVATPSNPASGKNRLYFKSDGKAYRLDSSGIESSLASGTSGINYILNPDFESATTGYSAYADAAGSSPVDGTGGSPTVTITRTTSSPLRGTGSGLITKDAANRQGEGVSYDFTIDSADQAKILQITADYTIASGTYASGDLTVYLYDVTNALVIQPAGYVINGITVGLPGKINATFQTASNSTSYRLIFHVASTSASAYTVKFDNIVVGPQIVEYGAPVTDWTSYTPTFTGFGTVSNINAYYRRVGGELELDIRFQAGAATATEARVSLPSGLSSADSTRILTLQIAGEYGRTTSSSAKGGLVLIEPSVTYVTFGDFNTFGSSSVSSIAKANGTAVENNASVMAFNAKLPITGWSSTVQMSNDTDTRVVAASYHATSAKSTSSTLPLDFDTKDFDTHNAVTAGSAWKYTVQVPGLYCVKTTTSSTAGTAALDVYKNGVKIRRLYNHINQTNDVKSGETTVSLVAGDYIDIRTPAANTFDNDATAVHISIERLSGPSAIAASETVAARASTSDAVSLPTSTATVITLSVTNDDSHGMVNLTNDRITIPVSGRYLVSASILANTTAVSNLSSAVTVSIRKNGSTTVSQSAVPTQTTSATYRGGSLPASEVKLIAGDYLELIVSHDTGSTLTLLADAGFNWISVVRVGS